jgi:hypothetical protein
MRVANALVFLVSIAVTFLIAEVGYRVITGVPLTETANWRLEGARTNRIGDRAIPDPVLGWTLVPGYRTESFNTIDYGIRRNFDETSVRNGAVLAVGDSFTEGYDEVDDAGTWPAYLEKLTGTPVVNGGVAGYATDQIILRAEQLLPIVQPKTLIVGFTEVDIYRAALSEAGAPKPYFSTENGQLVHHAPGPFERTDTEGLIPKAIRAVLGYSALADRLFSRLTPAFWYREQASLYDEVEIDSVDVTCKLLGRLKQQTDEKQIRMLLFLQYSGELVLEEPVIVPDMKAITECSQKLGIEVVDQFASLRALTKSTPELVALYYDLIDDEFGHMTAKGNEQAAQVLAAALKQVTPPPPQSSALPSQDLTRN